MRVVTILGAGLAGTLMALYLKRRGYQVELLESRSDLRINPADYGRSINLAMSCRGLTSLKAIGLRDEAEKLLVPMRARAIHEKNDQVSFQSFGRHEDEYINAIQRNDLNALLLDKAEDCPEISLHFNIRATTIDFDKKKIHYQDENGQDKLKSYQTLIGADGAASLVRECLKNAGIIEASREFLPHGYKELSISRNHQLMAREHLHLWPRDAFLLLGNPNTDDSITGSLFLANEGPNSFEYLNNEERIRCFFKNEFADVYPLMPDLVDEFLNHPIGNLGTVKAAPWYYGEDCLLIGDAAHGIVPFFGQGMNSAFEDCRVFDLILDRYQDDWSKALPAFYKERKINTDAVAAMSMDNYYEIQSGIIDRKFNLRKKLDHELMKRYPNIYLSKHVMVMFSNTAYALARAYGELQHAFLEKITENIEEINEVDWDKIDKMIPEYDNKLAAIELH